MAPSAMESTCSLTLDENVERIRVAFGVLNSQHNRQTSEAVQVAVPLGIVSLRS